MNRSLHAQMSVEDFDNGYWYALDLKAFAKQLGLTGFSKLRKDQLEVHIRQRLSGQLETTIPKRNTRTQKYDRDILDLESRVVHYVSDKITKQFIEQQALLLCPTLPAKSGRWYWLNRWREQQIQRRHIFTYRGLVQEFVRLCNSPGRLPQIPSARFNNFVSDFLTAEQGSREDALEAWLQLKKLGIPKTFKAWQETR